MVYWLWIFVVCLAKLIEACTVHPSTGVCNGYSLNATTIAYGAPYCSCTGCPAGTYMDSLFISCCSAGANCVTCLGSPMAACTECISGYHSDGTGCQTCASLMPNCITCSSNITCLACVSNLYALNGSSCPLCSDCLPYCITCNSNIDCIQCLNNSWTIYLGGCSLCSTLLMFCETCSSATTCTQCLSTGYMLANHSCLLCTFPISYCSYCFLDPNSNRVVCTKCDLFHIVDPITKYCLPCQSVITGCLACDSSSTNCQACVRDNSAVNVASIPQNCQPCNATLNYCTRCLNISLCIQCFLDPTIFLFRLANFTASFVPGGYYSISPYTGTSGICQFCNTSYNYCIFCNSSQCLVCISDLRVAFVSGYYCDLCSNILPFCDQCLSEFQCVQCKNSYYTPVTITPTVRICKFCCEMMAGCLLCDSPTTCISCSIGSIVIGGCSTVTGCFQVIQTGPYSSICIKCQPTEFNPTPVNGTCVCRSGHIAGKYCSSIIGCQIILRSILADTCASCNINHHFQLSGGVCPCIDHHHLVGDTCKETCGDGVMYEDECDDGNLFNLDGCSSDCNIEDKYVCHGGSQKTPSICRLSERIHISISEIRKEPNMNNLTVYLKVSHPTRHLLLINFTSDFHYSPQDLLKLIGVEVTTDQVKLSFNYFQDLPQILAKVQINLNQTYFIQLQLSLQFLLKATNGEGLYFDKWAGSKYQYINSAVFLVLEIASLVVSIFCSISYKMIGVETLHTFQLILIGMVFSRRYSYYFHNFQPTFGSLGQSSTILTYAKLHIPHKLAQMKYSDIFQSNLVIVGAIFTVFFCIFGIASLIQEVKYSKTQEELDEIILQKNDEKKELIKRLKLTIKQQILFPVSLGFFYHIFFCIIIQSYQFDIIEQLLYPLLVALLKFSFISAFVWIIFDQGKNSFISLPQFNPSIKYRGNWHFSKPLLPHEPANNYPAIYTIMTIIMAIYAAASILLNLKYYIQVNLILSFIRLISIPIFKPYQLLFHNTAIFFNSFVVLLAFIWLTLQQRYLLNPTMTNNATLIMFACLIGVLVLSILRVSYNAWIKYRGKEPPSKSTKIAHLAKRQQSKSEMEQLLSNQIGRFGKQIDTQKIGWKKKETLHTVQDEQKKFQLDELIKKSKQAFALNMKKLKSRSNLASFTID